MSSRKTWNEAGIPIHPKGSQWARGQDLCRPRVVFYTHFGKPGLHGACFVNGHHCQNVFGALRSSEIKS